MMRLAERDYRPPEVLELRRRIASAIEAAELRTTLTGEIDMERVEYIVGLRLQLDDLYGKWTVRESRLS